MPREIQIHQIEMADIELTPGEIEKDVNFVFDELHIETINLNIIFVDDPTLAQMHKDYLNDPGETDVITFSLSEDDAEEIEGEIYLSIDRAREQAKIYKVTIEEEVKRLVIHGILHLNGYNDLEDGESNIMKNEENRLFELIIDN